jgi:hypothetical protein
MAIAMPTCDEVHVESAGLSQLADTSAQQNKVTLARQRNAPQPDIESKAGYAAAARPAQCTPPARAATHAPTSTRQGDIPRRFSRCQRGHAASREVGRTLRARQQEKQHDTAGEGISVERTSRAKSRSCCPLCPGAISSKVKAFAREPRSNMARRAVAATRVGGAIARLAAAQDRHEGRGSLQKIPPPERGRVS